MGKRRDYAALNARRNQLARNAGFTSYSQERTAKRKLKESSADIQGKWNRFLFFKGSDLNREALRRAFRSFWQGLIDPRTNSDRSKHSPKSEWFVEWLEDVPDYETWEERYAGKAR